MHYNIPVGWAPRTYQSALWKALEDGTKRAVCVWHRRAGKDLCALNWTVCEAFKRTGLYWHIFPTYKQGRKILWDGMTRDGRSFLSHFPEDLVIRTRDDEMSVWLEGGSLWQVIGTDDPDKLVGANPVGCVFSEYSLQNPKVWNLIRPILAENGGWAMFIYTPRGRNHGYRLYKMAQENPTWFAEILSVDTSGAIPLSAVQEERDAGMAEEMIQQEFYCSFDAPLVGAYYGDLISDAQTGNRIGKVPWEPELKVTTAWDLGIADRTAIWFLQQSGHEHRAIDYYESSGVGLDHYNKVLSEKPYAYANHLVPHDAMVRELGTGKTRVESARKMGMRMKVAPKLPLADGINAVRMLIPKMWFDDDKCARGIQGLREYTKEQTEEEDVDGSPIFRDQPKHDWASHPADALRTYAVGHRREGGERRRQLAPKLAIV
jgi:hypothetical protein